MISHTVVRLDSYERGLLQRVVNSVSIAYPDVDKQKATNVSDGNLRGLLSVARGGGDTRYETLIAARNALEKQLAQCSIESDVDHWRHLLIKEPPKHVDGATTTLVQTGVPIVADPHQMCEYLAEMRNIQARDAVRALEVVNAALDLATPVQEEDDE